MKEIPDVVRCYFSHDGVLNIWPSAKNKALRTMVLEVIVSAFEQDKDYTDRETNDLLKSLVATGDHVLIRRELVDGGFLSRDRRGTAYRRIPMADEQ